MAPTEVEVRHRRAHEDPPGLETLTLDSDLSDDRKLVGVNGKWYDITDFISKHPGGPIIEMFVGKDASVPFKTMFNHGDILKHRKPVGTYRMANRHPADDDFEKLIRMFHEKGWFTTDWEWYARKTIVAVIFFIVAVTCVVGFEHRYIHYIGAIILTLGWQQCGFIMHDAMHKQLFRKNRWSDCKLGLLSGSFVLGFSAHWWHDEHIFHHVMCNTVDAETRFADPQMWENCWAQHEKLFPLFSGYIQYFFIKIQHITFIPFVIWFGRFEIVTDSYRLERRWYEIVALTCHWVYMIWLMSYLATWWEVFVFYFFVATVEGFFHFQLILSHYCKMFYTVDEFHATSWYVTQVLTNVNIDVHPYWDWIWGGLNFHVEHHLFPLLGRRHLREAGDYVKAICKKHNIDYDMCSMPQALVKTIKHLKKSGSHYKLEFR